MLNRTFMYVVTEFSFVRTLFHFFHRSPTLNARSYIIIIFYATKEELEC